jgi:hypothetical protein
VRNLLIAIGVLIAVWVVVIAALWVFGRGIVGPRLLTELTP